MFRTLAATIAISIAATTLTADELVPVSALGTPVPESAGREAAWPGHVDYVRWAGDNIVCAGDSGFIRCYEPTTKRQLWSAQLEKIEDIAVAPSLGRLFVLGGPRDFLTGVEILEFQLSDGKQVRKFADRELAKRVSKPFLILTSVSWMPDTQQLAVTSSTGRYGENAYVFDAGSLKPVATFRCDGTIGGVQQAKKRYLLTVSTLLSTIRIWDLEANREVFNLSQREGAEGEDDVAIDAPFISCASFDGDRTLVYIVDNSWATGTVHVHDIIANKELAKFDSRNGHAVMDVDFEHGRIALSGTDRSLTVLDLTGGVIASNDAAAFQRIGSIQFSPDGNRVALGSWDNTVRVFELRSGASK